MKQLILIFVLAGFWIHALYGQNAHSKKEQQVQIVTDYGTITIKLYDETPLHRDNFVKLTGEGFYTGLLFHRVIQGFMIQGGDPNSKNATPEQMLGNGDLGYTLPAEINPKFFHKRGVLAAARQGDQVNPEKRSSSCQFYIMQGKVFRETELDSLLLKLEDNRKMALLQAKIKALEPELNKLSMEGRQEELRARIDAVRDSVASEAARLPRLSFSAEQRKAYTSIGGYPSLDNNYTIFGEVVDGMNVVDSIARQPVNPSSRPLKDIRFSIRMLNKQGLKE